MKRSVRSRSPLRLRRPSEAREAAEWALLALDDIPEDIRSSSELVGFVRGVASALLAESETAPWSRRMHRRCEDLETTLNEMATGEPLPPPSRQHRPRKPSIATLFKRAEKAGRPVTSITLADGTKLTFGEATPTDAKQQSNELDKWMARHACLPERH